MLSLVLNCYVRVFIICTLLHCIHIYMYNFYPNKSNKKYISVSYHFLCQYTQSSPPPHPKKHLMTSSEDLWLLPFFRVQCRRLLTKRLTKREVFSLGQLRFSPKFWCVLVIDLLVWSEMVKWVSFMKYTMLLTCSEYIVHNFRLVNQTFKVLFVGYFKLSFSGSLYTVFVLGQSFSATAHSGGEAPEGGGGVCKRKPSIYWFKMLFKDKIRYTLLTHLLHRNLFTLVQGYGKLTYKSHTKSLM